MSIHPEHKPGGHVRSRFECLLSMTLLLVAELDKKPESRNILRRLFEFRAPKVGAYTRPFFGSTLALSVG